MGDSGPVDVCVRERGSECVHAWIGILRYAHTSGVWDVGVCSCVFADTREVCMGERACVFLCLCVCLQTQRLHNVGAASCVLPACMLCKRQAATCVSHAHA